MEATWYAIIAGMLTAYVVLDGFDIGAGILHLFLGKEDASRRQVLSAIGPFWNGNEVWLISSGGLLVFAFPRVYAAGFSGFYLPLMMVLWLLVFRGLSIEFRSKEENPLWRTFWDTVFGLSSLIMAIVLGAALGNVIRGVPLDASGYFNGALFTDFLPGRVPGVLDWYTVSVGVFAAVVLAGHGALYLAWKTADGINMPSRAAARFLWPAIVGLGVVVTFLTTLVRPELYETLVARPWTWVFPVLILGSLVNVFIASRKGKDLSAFLSSCVFITSLLAATAAGMYPNMLISTLDPAYNVTAMNGSIGTRGLTIGVYWWVPTIVLAIIYFANLFRTFRDKTKPSSDAYGH